MEKAALIKWNSEFPSRHRVLKIIPAELYPPLSQHLPAASKINSSLWVELQPHMILVSQPECRDGEWSFPGPAVQWGLPCTVCDCNDYCPEDKTQWNEAQGEGLWGHEPAPTLLAQAAPCRPEDPQAHRLPPALQPLRCPTPAQPVFPPSHWLASAQLWWTLHPHLFLLRNPPHAQTAPAPFPCASPPRFAQRFQTTCRHPHLPAVLHLTPPSFPHTFPRAVPTPPVSPLFSPKLHLMKLLCPKAQTPSTPLLSEMSVLLSSSQAWASCAGRFWGNPWCPKRRRC